MKQAICIILLGCSLVYGQRAKFIREDITIHLDGKRMFVEGYYWFVNPAPGPVDTEIFYPFPYRAGKAIDSVGVFDLNAGGRLVFKCEEQFGISFNLYIPPKDTTVLKIQYHQELNSDSAVYILRTTQGWAAPLTQAEFKLVTPGNLKIVEFPWPPDKTYNLDDQLIYYWRKNEFMPDHDLVVRFRNR